MWTGHKELAEHYWDQLRDAGLTMAPLELASLTSRGREPSPPCWLGRYAARAMEDAGGHIETAGRAAREQELLRRYHHRGDTRARDQLAEEMLPLARALAGRSPAAASRWTTSSRSPASGS